MLRWRLITGLVIIASLALITAGAAPATSPATLPASIESILAATAPPATAPAPPAANTPAVIIQLAGQIDDYNRDALMRKFDDARKLGAKVVVLDVDTYGGLVTAGLEISRFLKRQTDIHTIAFVKDKAISAGAMISMACDEIVMGDSASLGDCAPIIYGAQGLEAMPPAERAKMETPILVDFEESARRNHRDPLLAKAMVSVDISAYWVEGPDHSRRFVNKDQHDALLAAGWKDVAGAKIPVDSDTTLLTVDSQHAVQYGLATGPVSSAEALVSQRGYNLLANLAPSSGERFVAFLGSTWVRGLLLVIFLQCLYISVSAPGHGAAEAAAVISLALLLGVPLLTGYAQWWELVAILLGLSLIAVEIFVLPGHLAPGIIGAFLVLLGFVMTFVPKTPGGLPGGIPNLHFIWPALQQGLMVVAGGLACSIVLWIWLSRYLPKLPYFSRLILTATVDGVAPGAKAGDVTAGANAQWPLVGALGQAVSDLRPGGSAEFFDDAISDGRVTAVVSDSGYVPAGSKVTVREVAGSRVVVRAAKKT